jgi:FkbM family methyltransferase
MNKSSKWFIGVAFVFGTVILIILLIPNPKLQVDEPHLEINPYGNIKYNVYPTKHWPEFWKFVNNRIWEPTLFETIDKYVDKDTTYIDFGTWIGPTLIFGCKLAKKCYGLEPDPVAYKEALRNIQLNNINVEFLEKCVAVKNGPVVMYSKSLGNSESSIYKNTYNWTVNCVTMPDLYSLWNVEGKVFMKIDIEGAEYNLLSCWYEWIQKLPVKPMLYISLHGDGSGRILIKSLYSEFEARDNILFLIK